MYELTTNSIHLVNLDKVRQIFIIFVKNLFCCFKLIYYLSVCSIFWVRHILFYIQFLALCWPQIHPYLPTEVYLSNINVNLNLFYLRFLRKWMVRKQLWIRLLILMNRQICSCVDHNNNPFSNYLCLYYVGIVIFKSYIKYYRVISCFQRLI